MSAEDRIPFGTNRIETVRGVGYRLESPTAAEQTRVPPPIVRPKVPPHSAVSAR
jgi:hypothetical protein